MPRRIWLCGTRTSSWPDSQATAGDGTDEGSGGTRPGAWLGSAGGCGQTNLRCDGGLGGRSGGPLPRGGSARPDSLDDRDHVLAGDPAAVAGSDHVHRGEALFAHEHAYRRRHASVGVADDLRCNGEWRGSGRAGRGRSDGSGGRRSGCRRNRRRRSRLCRRLRGGSARSTGSGDDSCRFLDDGDVRRIRNRLPLLDEHLAQDSGERGRDFGVDLVGDNFQERLVQRDFIADLFEPLPDRPLGHALAELRHRHLGHEIAPPRGLHDERADQPTLGAARRPRLALSVPYFGRRRAGCPASGPLDGPNWGWMFGLRRLDGP